MKNKSIRHVMALAAAGLLTGLCLPSSSRAHTNDPGYDLFSTVAGGTVFNGMNFHGVPLDTYNFGGSIGLQNVGATDTIVQRLQTVTPTGSTSLQMDALQLESVAPMFGPSTYGFITLDGTPSTGTLNINNNGTFTSTLNVYFDVCVGSLTGPVAETGEVTLSAAGDWSHNAPPESLLIPGVNYDLNGVDASADFWPSGAGGPSTPFSETGPFDGFTETHEVGDTVPDAASTLALLLMPLGLLALAAGREPAVSRA
jgi:hypothetical protein